MKFSQSQHILSLLRANPDRKVSCGTLARFGCYHHASQRIGELNRKSDEHGNRLYNIQFFKEDTWDQSYYEMIFDIEKDVVKVKEISGQLEWAV